MKNPAPSVLYQRARATRTRAEILSVAVNLASAEGLEGLTIGRLATESHMSKTGIFAHFGSKEQLQLATVGAAKEIFLQQVVKPGLTSPRGSRPRHAEAVPRRPPGRFPCGRCGGPQLSAGARGSARASDGRSRCRP